MRPSLYKEEEDDSKSLEALISEDNALNLENDFIHPFWAFPGHPPELTQNLCLSLAGYGI